MIGLMPDSASDDVFYGLGNCLVRWRAATNEFVQLSCRCRVWGISQHTVTGDVYFGCREGSNGLYRLPADHTDGPYSTSNPATETLYIGERAMYQVVDSANNELYYTNNDDHVVMKLKLSGSFDELTVIAGDNGVGYSGDGGLATDAQLNYPTGIAMKFDSKDIFVYDQSDETIKAIRHISSTGIIRTLMAANGCLWNGNTMTALTGGYWDDGAYPMSFCSCCGSGSLVSYST